MEERPLGRRRHTTAGRRFFLIILPELTLFHVISEIENERKRGLVVIQVIVNVQIDL
jgi:hypothetical protein